MSADGEFQLAMDYKGRRYVSATAGLRAFAHDLNEDADLLAPELKAELLVFLRSIATDLGRQHGSAYPSTGPGRLSRRSGRAQRSIMESVRVFGGKTLESVGGEIGGVGYLRIHEFSGTVKARRSKYLTIPLPAALRANGTAIKPRARDWPNTFVITSKKGNKLIVQRRGKEIVPLYVLKTEVRIPARLGMRARIQRDAPVFSDRALDRMHKRLLRNHA